MNLPCLALALGAVSAGALRLPDGDSCTTPADKLKPGCGLLVIAAGHKHVKEGMTNWLPALVTQEPIPSCPTLEVHVYTDALETFRQGLEDLPMGKAELARKRWSLHLRDVQELRSCAEEGYREHQLFKYYQKVLLMKFAGSFEIAIMADTDIQLKKNDTLAQYVEMLGGRDLVISMERNQFGGSGSPRYPRPPGLGQEEMTEFARYGERMTGFVAFNMRSPAVRKLIQLWGQRFKECMDDCCCQKVIHDQPSFREALFELRSEIKEELCSPDKCCKAMSIYACPPGACTNTSCIFWHGHGSMTVAPPPVRPGAPQAHKCTCPDS
mmetsp:Transcript_34545/g.107316  ORF Transcript_34545/g.107316 Transcript_34545/m.107316 type:complete len:325 (+) Transcript_34545:124-1098(+)